MRCALRSCIAAAERIRPPTDPRLRPRAARLARTHARDGRVRFRRRRERGRALSPGDSRIRHSRSGAIRASVARAASRAHRSAVGRQCGHPHAAQKSRASIAHAASPGARYPARRRPCSAHDGSGRCEPGVRRAGRIERDGRVAAESTGHRRLHRGFRAVPLRAVFHRRCP